jgi:hypothetical protein
MEPAAMLRTITSSGMISTSRTSCSRMLRRRMKWVGRPMLVELGEDELADAVVEHALALDHRLLLGVEGGCVVLEVNDDGARLGPSYRILALPS